MATHKGIEEMERVATTISIVITTDGAVSAWESLFDARAYADRVDGEIVDAVEVQPKGTRC